MTTGSRNSVSSVENAIANVLLNASGLNSRPSRSPRKKIGRNDVTMISIEKSSGRVIVAVALDDRLQLLGCASTVAPPGELRRAVLDDDDGRVGHLADGDGQPGQREQIDGLVEGRERQRREQRAEQQDADRRDGRADVLQRDGNDEDDDDQLVDDRLEEVASACPRSAPSGCRSVTISTPCGQRASSACSSFCSSVRVTARTFRPCSMMAMPPTTSPVAVEIGDAAAKVVADLQVADVLAAAPAGRLGRGRATRYSSLSRSSVFDAAAQLILAVGDLDRAAAGLLERPLQRARDLRAARCRARLSSGGSSLHLVLLFEPADRCDFRDAGRRLQRRLDDALVQQPQLAQVVGALPVDERVLEDPAHAAGVGADDDVGVSRQLRADRVEAIGDELADGRAAAGVARG